MLFEFLQYALALGMTGYIGFQATNLVYQYWPRTITVRVKHKNGDFTVYKMKNYELMRLCKNNGISYADLIGSGSGE